MRLDKINNIFEKYDIPKIEKWRGVYRIFGMDGKEIQPWPKNLNQAFWRIYNTRNSTCYQNTDFAERIEKARIELGLEKTQMVY